MLRIIILRVQKTYSPIKLVILLLNSLSSLGQTTKGMAALGIRQLSLKQLVPRQLPRCASKRWHLSINRKQNKARETNKGWSYLVIGIHTYPASDLIQCTQNCLTGCLPKKLLPCGVEAGQTPQSNKTVLHKIEVKLELLCLQGKSLALHFLSGHVYLLNVSYFAM